MAAHYKMIRGTLLARLVMSATGPDNAAPS
jgi:hypothetical protein